MNIRRIIKPSEWQYNQQDQLLLEIEILDFQ